MGKKLPAALLAALLSLSLLSGCWNNIDINRLSFVMGIAVDRDDAENQYTVTAQIARPSALSSLGDSGGGEDAYTNLTQTATSVELAMNQISLRTNRRIYAGHNQIIVISMDAAKQDITPVLDYFVRRADGRFTASLYISEGSANELMEIKGGLEKLPAIYLSQLTKSRIGPGETAQNSIISFLASFLSKTSAPVISILKIVDDENGEQRAEPSGMAVFKGAQVCTALDPKQAAAVIAILNKAQGEIWQIDVFGGYMDLEVLQSRVDTVPVFSGDRLEKIRVDLDFGCSIINMAGNADILSPDVRDQVAEVVKADILDSLCSTFEYTQKYSADVFGFGELLHRYHPRKTKDLIENWETAYPELAVEFNVKVEILSTGSIIQPFEPGAGNQNIN